jgi:hypothetical protein
MSNTTAGGVWGKTTTNITIIGSVVYGAAVGTATILYSVTNMCGTGVAVRTITVNPTPSLPVISVYAPSAVCKGTMFQNFGTTTSLPAGTVYNWTAINAIVWAQGTSEKNTLINFNNSGNAYVTLNTTILATGCTVAATIAVNVNTSVSQIDYVSYFNGHFVCTPNNETTYQWGYDDANTLDSTILRGETNQDYVNITPDFTNKKYWVMTTLGTCTQKTYFKAPLTVQGASIETASIKIYPNPAADIANIIISGVTTGTVEVEIWNMMGQRVQLATATNNKATMNVTELPAGTYIVTCYADGVKITSARFIKN